MNQALFFKSGSAQLDCVSIDSQLQGWSEETWMGLALIYVTTDESMCQF